jgi:salicylate hydroxylase
VTDGMGRTPRIAIIGGGIGGLSAALALYRRGIEVAVYEQSPQLSEVGAGLSLSPNALKACRALGIADDVIAAGSEAERQTMRTFNTGRVITSQPIGTHRTNFGAPSVTLHRADLLSILASSLPESCIRLSARCTSVTPGDKGAAAQFADGSAIEADIIVGADGIHSVVRDSLFGAEAPRFTGCVCYRGLVPVGDLPAGLNPKDNTLWMGPHGHIVHYLVRRGELLNVVAHFDSDAWTEESWTRQCDKAELLSTYSGWHESLLALFERKPRWYKWALYDRDLPERWSKGRGVLLGDSAHAMLPYLGQGAAMSIEDGCILAAVIALTPHDLDTALVQYEQIRKPRASRAVLGSRARAKENHLTSPWARRKRDIKYAFRDRFAADKTAFRAAWLYGYDVAAEPALQQERAAVPH